MASEITDLKEYKEQHGLTWDGFADLIGLSRGGMISKLHANKGYVKPWNKTLNKIQNYLQVNLIPYYCKHHIGKPLPIPSKERLINEKPQNIEEIDNLEPLYSKSERRKKLNAIEILLYWEVEFSLDWGEPICFACRQFFPEGEELIQENSKRKDSFWREHGCEGETDFSVFDVWDRYLTQSHIIPASHGGPQQAWNIVYLCSMCHTEFDTFFWNPKPKCYQDKVEWVKSYRHNIKKRIDELVAIRQEKLNNLSFDTWRKMKLMAVFMKSKKATKYIYSCGQDLVTAKQEATRRVEFALDKLIEYDAKNQTIP